MGDICMKKIVIILVAFLFSLSALSAESSVDAYNKVYSILDDEGLYGQENLIRSELMFLSLDDREDLYNNFRKSIFMPSILNMIPFCGIGSFVQGDTTTGWVTVIGQTASMAAFIMSLTLLSDWEYYQWIAIPSMVCFGGFYLNGIFSAPRYSIRHNDALYDLLLGEPEVAFVPYINPESMEPGAVLMARIPF